MPDYSRESALQVASWLLKHAPRWPNEGPALKVQRGMVQWIDGGDVLGNWTHDEWRGIAEAILAACHSYATERRTP